MVIFGRNLILLFLAIGAVEWLTMARIVRSQVLNLSKQEFILSAEAMGVSKISIVFRHLIPNAMGPVIVYATLTVPQIMLLEAFLSFLRIGSAASFKLMGITNKRWRGFYGRILVVAYISFFSLLTNSFLA